MIFRYLIFFLFLYLSLNVNGYTQQRIKDFYLSNYKEDGTRDWEIKGEEAIIYDKYVDILKMKAKYYLENDTISIKSQKAKLDKEDFTVYLEDKVHIENKEGIKLLTDFLKWERKKNRIETPQWVKANRNNMEIEAKGLSADTQFKKVDFKEDVKVKFPDKEGKDFTTITCSGPLEIEYNEGKAVFNKNVIVEYKEGKLFADKATVFFDTKNRKIIKIVSEGKVKIIRDDNIIFAQKATYISDEARVILEGNPRVIYFSKENETTGN
jgi:LPS export ABC transporter protein LptC